MTQNVFETISSQYFDLTNSEKKVADYVLGHRIDVQYMSISELAEECEVADATISRFCRRLGLPGYNAFKLELARASMAARTGLQRAPVSPAADGFSALCKQVLGENISALEQTFRLVDPDQLMRAVELIERSRRVVCMGQGGSMVLAQEAWTLFSMVSSKFVYVPDSHLQINTLAVMEADEAVLYFSYSGSTRDLQDALEVARARRVPMILVSRFPKSPGGQQADVVLQCGVNESPLQPGSVSARMAQLLILDLLFQQLCSRNQDQVDEYRARIAEAAAKKHL
jgi:DNA-binding MurR/RpiR family transcriptional regulator